MRRVVVRKRGLVLNAVLLPSEASGDAGCTAVPIPVRPGHRNAWKHGDRSAEAEEQLKVITANSRILRLLGKVRQGVNLRPDEMDEIIFYLR